MNLKQITTVSLLLIGSFGAVSNLSAADETLPPPPPPAHEGKGPGGPGGRMNPEERIKMLTEALGLSEAQLAKLTPLIKAEMQDMRALRDAKDLTPEQRKEKGKAIREASKLKIRAELTPEQVTKLEAWEKNHPAGGPRGERGPKGEHKGADKQQ